MLKFPRGSLAPIGPHENAVYVLLRMSEASDLLAEAEDLDMAAEAIYQDHLQERFQDQAEVLAVERKKTGDWRDAIGVLKGHFPEGMKSEDIIWCEYSGMLHGEFMMLHNAGINPRDYESTIQAHAAYLWDRAIQPDVVEAMVEAMERPVWPETGSWPRKRLRRIRAKAALTAALTLLLGPRESESTDADR